jgi:hypothetical protein
MDESRIRGVGRRKDVAHLLESLNYAVRKLLAKECSGDNSLEII